MLLKDRSSTGHRETKMDIIKHAAIGPPKAVPFADVWWHRPWVKATEAVIWHVAAVIVGFVMMVVGLALGVTMVMLPIGLAIGLLGVAIFVTGLFAHITKSA
jgi:vacuolar-type H+-ATPase subunit I/STV1